MKRLVMTGKWFGRLLVIKEDGKHVLAVCECENLKIYSRTNVLAGYTQSCGCLRNERVKAVCTTHGQKSEGKVSGAWRTWAAMKSRCDDPNRTNYKWYGGKGISYAIEWTSFENFFRDMGERPIGMELDRIDSSKGYYKENCRWVTHAENMRNKG